MTDCRHHCCDTRADPFHSHFLEPQDCAACRRSRLCPVCKSPVLRARDESGASVLIEPTPSRTRGTLEVVKGGHPDGGLLVRPVEDRGTALLYVDHTVCPVPH